MRAETDPCRDLLFLLKGTIDVSHSSSNHRIVFTETWNNPTVIGAESIFGLSQHHQRTYRASSDLQTLSIGKEFITSILLQYEVFRFNLLGLLSTRIQRSNRMLWDTPRPTLLHRFVQVLQHNFNKPSGEKHIYGKLVDLAPYVDATRLNLSILLNRLQDEGLIQMERKHLTLSALEKIILYAQEHEE